MKCPDCFEKVVVPRPRRASGLTVNSVSELGDHLQLRDDEFDRPRYEPLTRGMVSRQQLNAAGARLEGAGRSPGAEKPAGPAPIAFECPVCGSGLLASVERAGQLIRCSDCETETRVPPPPAPLPAEAQAEAEAEDMERWPEFRLAEKTERPAVMDEMAQQVVRQALEKAEEQANKRGLPVAASMPSERSSPPPSASSPGAASAKSSARAAAAAPAAPVLPAPAPDPVPPPVAPPLARSAGVASQQPQQSGEPPLRTAPPQEKAASKTQRWLAVAKSSVEQSPGLPPWASLAGTWRFILQPGVVLCWMGIWLGLVIELGAYVGAVAFYRSGGASLFLSVLMTLALMGLLAPFVMFLSACGLAVCKDTANGIDEVEAPPEEWFLDWFSNVAILIVSLLLSTVPAALLGRLLAFHNPLHEFLLITISAGACFPIIVLSVLDAGTFLPPLSPNVADSMRLAPAAWIRMYWETLLLTVPFVGGFWLVTSGWLTMVLGAALIAATMLVYFRRLGVLGLACAGALKRDAARASAARK